MSEIKCEHDWFDCSNERVLPPAKSCRKCGWTVGEDEERGMFVQWPWLPALSSDAVAERVAEPVASVAEVRADGQRLYNTVYPSDALDKFPIGTLLYTSPPTSELEALRKRVAELEKPSREKFYYPIVMPVDADGQGPADIKDAAKLTWEVWDQELTRHGSFDFLADAIDLANELNARRVREGGKVDG